MRTRESAIMRQLREWLDQVKRMPAVIMGLPYARFTSLGNSRPVDIILRRKGDRFPCTLNLTWYSGFALGTTIEYVCNPLGCAAVDDNPLQPTIVVLGSGTVEARAIHPDGRQYYAVPIRLMTFEDSDNGA
jgi:hypothetical protein